MRLPLSDSRPFVGRHEPLVTVRRNEASLSSIHRAVRLPRTDQFGERQHQQPAMLEKIIER
jgi:hypothetical protein